MASGNHRMVINTQERAISPDINRLQAFASKDSAELLRYLLDVTGNDDLDAGAVVVEPNTSETPLRGEIINGLLVRPQAGSLNLFVDPGVAMLMAPDGGVDDSNYKYVHDAGLTTPGVLTMGAGGGGATRIDVIECQINAVDLIVSDNRDIFNTVTGLFSATSVTKERSGRLTYRVRQGVAGAGFPGAAAGWLPLVVASVPAAAVNNDGMAFWDVRPLINDRAWALGNLVNARPILGRRLVNAIAPTAITGTLEGVVAGRRLGGRIRSGSAGVADAENLDATAAANQEPGTVFTLGRPWYLYYLTPFGLPRWARYTTAGARLPRSPRGIPVVSMTAPNSDGVPSAAIVLPTVMGFAGASTTAGAALIAGHNSAGGGAPGAFFGDEQGTILHDPSADAGEPMQVTAALAGAPGPIVTATYNLTAGTHYPTHARWLLCEFRADLTYDAGGSEVRQSLSVFGPNGGPAGTDIHFTAGARVPGAVAAAGSAVNPNTYGLIWVPLPTVYPATAAPTQRLDVLYNAGAGGNISVAANAFVRILGWKLG